MAMMRFTRLLNKSGLRMVSVVKKAIIGLLVVVIVFFIGRIYESQRGPAPDGTHALRVKFTTSRHSVQVRQEVCAMMALNMLRRWLNGQPVAGEHGWINVVESLTV